MAAFKSVYVLVSGENLKTGAQQGSNRGCVVIQAVKSKLNTQRTEEQTKQIKQQPGLSRIRADSERQGQENTA